MKGNNIHEIIGKYLAEDISEKERNLFFNWLNYSEERKKEFELHKKAWHASKIKFESKNSELVFKNVLNKIDEEQEIEISNNSSSGKRHFSLSTIAKIAASIVVFLTLIYFISANLETETVESDKISFITKHNPSGQKSRIFLPDGSSVWLNAESKISYPEKFSDSIRLVSLVGEAFFDVVKNPNKPFIVNSEDLSTTVLGTSFNVRAFDTDPITLVALQTGKVKVEFKYSEDAKTMFLDPGEAMTFNKSESSVQKNKFDEEMLLGWKDGIIKFEDADVDHVFNTLSRWYGVKFEIKNRENQSWTYRGTFENKNLDGVLSEIKFVQDISYDWKDQKSVIITLN